MISTSFGGILAAFAGFHSYFDKNPTISMKNLIIDSWITSNARFAVEKTSIRENFRANPYYLRLNPTKILTNPLKLPILVGAKSAK